MEIIQWPTNNFGYPEGRSGRNGYQAVAIVNHTMEGDRAGYHAYLADPDKNSANYSTYRDGHVEQHVPLWCAAWCNGPMAAPDTSIDWIRRCWEKGINPNLLTVSIEHEGRSGEPLTEAQYQATVWLHRHIQETFPLIPFDREHVVGHYQIDSVNKARCPGSAFPWARLMADLAGVTHAPNIPVDPILARTGSGLRAYYEAHRGQFGPAFDQWYDARGNEVLLTGATGAHPRGHYHVAHQGDGWKVTSTCSCHPPSLP